MNCAQFGKNFLTNLTNLRHWDHLGATEIGHQMHGGVLETTMNEWCQLGPWSRTCVWEFHIFLWFGVWQHEQPANSTLVHCPFSFWTSSLWEVWKRPWSQGYWEKPSFYHHPLSPTEIQNLGYWLQWFLAFRLLRWYQFYALSFVDPDWFSQP